MKRASTNWTSTEVPMWDMDCMQFWRAGLPFELRGVTTPEHEAFVQRFAADHQLTAERDGTTIRFRFSPSDLAPSEPTAR